MREIGYRGFICIGGHQAVMLRHEIISELDIDAIANGDGEITTVELMKALSGGYLIIKFKGFITRRDMKSSAHTHPQYGLNLINFPTLHDVEMKNTRFYR